MNHPFDYLKEEKFIRLSTYRKNGEVVATPVWFSREGDLLYVMTQDDSGKIKRLRNNPSVMIAPCDVKGTVLGETVKGKVRILDKSEFKQAHQIMLRKYGFLFRLFMLRFRFWKGSQVYFVIEAV